MFLIIFIEWDLFNIEDIKEDILFYLGILFLSFSNLINNRFFANSLYFVYILYVILETTSYIAVSSNFSSSYMYLLLESNKQELNEFASSYISNSIILFIVLSCLLFFFIKKNKFGILNKYYSFLGFIIITVFLKFTGLIESNAYHNVVRGTYGYINLQNSVKLNSKISKSDIIIQSDNEVLVVVLGESTARGHMQLYGYHRQNTPLLNSIKDSLFVYNDVISSDVFTLKSVPKMLTSLDVNSKNNEVTNIVEVFNVAGFKTYWLSNQRPISYHDNAISKIASASTMFKFYNHIIEKNTLSLDEVIFPDYNEILKEPGKKIIFIRLIGTHFNYEKRYPESFNVFNKEDGKTSKEQTIINQYDNAILYNDFIIYNLIKDLNKNSNRSALLYMSDHGENLYHNGTDFFGRSEEILTETMFEIPFLLWTSKNFNFPKDFQYNQNRKFMADHTYDCIGHLFGVMHKNMNINNSIFSKSFLSRKRKVIDNTLDFDNYFIEKNE
ncbi:phosphoethanolamine transferase [Flaviramulus sp. BrNp1-15]|uniref:phosphoethanolamine transferase n=1 Tax=Flaviramulus sp. BrNp1-15 TaxID=2916754 RepID=UPI001EE8F559|nr:phosphoethanolamine transferase [Flaviramulus sp. BrNp1-15]ULC58998.1 phosphoethanolamine transferase [Flaviramulus sp. BrNp1-15]